MPVELVAAYRLQFRPGFGFDEAAQLAPYLRALGVSHAYCSPYLQARAGSRHGYDGVDPTRVSIDCGGMEGHVRFCEALGRAGLGQILDIVPNHMAIGGPDNAWWWDVLENGPASVFAPYFDVDWDSPDPELNGKVLLPILGASLHEVLESQALKLDHQAGRWVIRYGEQVLPTAPGSVGAAEIEQALSGPEAMHALLMRQHYRLTSWDDSIGRLNYRRFFDIDQLIGLRVEDEAVFKATHGLVLGWLARGVVDGVRIDHIDGLLDPQGYLLRLREHAEGAGIWVEKILQGDELLPPDWPVGGTTGYEFANRVLRLYVDPAGEAELTRCYAEFTGEPLDFEAIARDCRHMILRTSLAPELDRLIAGFERIRAAPGREALSAALPEVIASFPVYRTYVRPGPAGVSEEDVRRVEEAISVAGRRAEVPGKTLEWLRDVLLLRNDDPAARLAAFRFQQVTGPVMAKGVEDTAFYRFNRLVCLNEVGGDPARFSISVAEFHAACAETQRRSPRTLVATATHDTKRGEDVRARLALLSEVPRQWQAAVQRWAAMNQRRRLDDYPDFSAEYLLYQTLAGAWPITVQRAADYMEKAAREAKRYTSWTHPNRAYESSLRHFVETILTDADFVADLRAFVDPLIEPGRLNALAMTLLKLTSPGIPDIYQGAELWSLTLVDPDNRDLVDYGPRRRLLDQLCDLAPEAILARSDEGLPKLHVIQRALAVRRRRPDCFGPAGDYRPMQADGLRKEHVVAFVRGDRVVTVVPRLVLGLGGDWADTRLSLPAGGWRNRLTGELVEGTVPLVELLARFPVALLDLEEDHAA